MGLFRSAPASPLPAPLPAATTATTGPNTAADSHGARRVHVGIYLNQIHEVNIKGNKFTADFYVWFRWLGNGDFKPHETFEVMNGRVESKEVNLDTTLTNVPLDESQPAVKLPEVRYAQLRVVATITHFYDISRFPLDDHDLAIMIEDEENEKDKVLYLADRQKGQLSPEVAVPGWRVGEYRAAVVTHGYRSNFGDTSLESNAKSVYSRFVFTIPLLRSGWGYFFKLFAGLFTATLISMLVFFIKPTEVDPRFGLGVGAIFGAVASEYVVTSSLPDTSVMTMADTLHIVAFVFIFISIGESVYSLKLYGSEQEKLMARSRKLDRWCALLMATGYVVASALVVALS